MDRKRDDAEQRRADALAEALRKSAEIDETGAYLARGRLHKGVTIEQLYEAWVVAFRTWWATRGNPAAMDDLAAELRLRGCTPPYDKIEEERRQMHAELLNADPNDPAVAARVNEFLASIKKPNA